MVHITFKHKIARKIPVEVTRKAEEWIGKESRSYWEWFKENKEYSGRTKVIVKKSPVLNNDYVKNQITRYYVKQLKI